MNRNEVTSIKLQIQRRSEQTETLEKKIEENVSNFNHDHILTLVVK